MCVGNQKQLESVLKQYGTNPLDSVGYLQAGGSKKNRKNKGKKGGGSSDWRSTVYSRGPYNYPGQNKNQFSKFADPKSYISNAKLSNGAASCFNPLTTSSVSSIPCFTADCFNLSNSTT